MARALVIVESVAKATRIQGMLGPDYIVKPSIGHIRDLPQSAADIPASVKGEKWARLGINVNDHFKPVYVVSSDRKKIVSELKAALKEVDELYLATDEDREGEAIAWHLQEVLNPKVPVRRMVFHEITPAAISKAVDETRDLDLRLVDAQEGRRFLDRLVGYEVSPVLWRAVDKARSAGRVQSVAIRLVCERERERMAFRSATWFDVTVTLTSGDTTFEATLETLNGAPLATGKNFDALGALEAKALELLSEGAANSIAGRLPGSSLEVAMITSTPRTQRPQAPFMTSSLQIEASRKLRFDPERTMRAAQRLYEQGWITYMRTDSTTLSDEAIRAARSQAASMFGDDYVADHPRRYDRKVKNAQEAHEAIRPAGESFRTLDEAHQLHGDERALYDLIWKRTIASQMVDARLTQDRVRLTGTLANVEGYDSDVEVGLAASGLRIEFAGFRRAYVEGTDDPEAELADQERILPTLSEGASVPVASAEAKAHDTQPPDRYSEATLIKKLEDLGIGRPSTYASVMKTIDRRGYVWKKGKSLVPTFRAFAVVNLLEHYFADLVDYQFTAAMEDQLDEIAQGRQDLEPWLRKFYFGDATADSEFARLGLEHMTHEPHEFDFAAINSLGLGVAPDGLPVSVRSGRYGPYLVHGEDRVSIPEATEPDSLTVERALELLAAPSNDRELGHDDDGETIYLKAGRYGPYVQIGEMSDPKDKPRTASLFSTMSPETITLDDAMRLLALPRHVGEHPEGGDILAQNGRYGPYLTWAKETRSLDDESQIFTVDLDRALALFAEPKQRGRRAAAKPLAELGEDPTTKRQVVVRSGRFGLYVTDGETNATLRIGDTPESITLDRASELLAERRNAEPSTRVRTATNKASKSVKGTKAANTTKKARSTTKKAAKSTKKASVTKTTAAAKRAKVAQGAEANAALLRQTPREDEA
ncbi:MAG TPA: type I DNA topoisomerase [Acidimicrobiales bacterium]|nr:type I DNA topoisomerase [Acidimicrobiales bacterium]